MGLARRVTRGPSAALDLECSPLFTLFTSFRSACFMDLSHPTVITVTTASWISRENNEASQTAHRGSQPGQQRHVACRLRIGFRPVHRPRSNRGSRGNHYLLVVAGRHGPGGRRLQQEPRQDQRQFRNHPQGASGGYAKLSTAITAGNGPDVATIEYPQLPLFVSNGQVQPLNGLIDEAETVDKLAAEIRGQVEFGDKIYGLPYDAAPMVMYYRQDMLEKAGVEVPKTWAGIRGGRQESSRRSPPIPTWQASTRTKLQRPRAWLGRQAAAGSMSQTTAGRSASTMPPPRRWPTSGRS